MQFEYKTKGTCSAKILFEVDQNRVKNVTFIGGCNGNLQGISRLIEGMDIDEVIEKVKGICCGPRPTSCPDQLANALLAAKKQMNS